MRNPHRVFEESTYECGTLPWSNLPFLQQFERLIDHQLANPVDGEDPRQRMNMQPEPYRPSADILADLTKLRRHALEMVRPSLSKWDWLYSNLSDEASKKLLLLVLAYRALSWRYVRLPLDNQAFRNAIGAIGELADNENLPAPILEKGMQRFGLRPLDRNISVYSDPFGIFNEFVYSQYSYRGMTRVVQPEIGDYVLDCGACYGGTTVNFADLVGPKGRVYSFEFLSDNTMIYEQNVAENLNIINRVTLVRKPVSSESGRIMSIVGTGPATQVHFADIEGAQKVESIKIDDFVFNNGFPRLDFIKMDIEGSEIEALKGATQTIERFRPKMAICVYHKLTDFYEVPLFLKGIHDDYKIYFGHSTIHGDESVIFAV